MSLASRRVAGLTEGALVRVRGQRGVVGAVEPGSSAVVELNSIEDGRYGETLHVVWAVETDARVVDAGALPGPGDFDSPPDMAAFLDAARWSAATSADVYHLQAPFRAGVVIEDYQLEPLARALVAPRVNLLLADDVGLGKTIEAGLVALELLLRHRARTVLVVCPAGLTTKWRDELEEKFGLGFTIVDADECARLRRVRGAAANPFRSHRLIIVSLPWLRTARAQRLLDEVLPAEVDPRQRTFDLLILDEAHHVAPAAPKQRYAVDSQQTKLVRHLVPHCEHRLFLSATPHNGYRESFAALLELVDDQRFARGAPIDAVSQRETMIRRLKQDVALSSGEPFQPRRSAFLEVDYTDEERRAYHLVERFAVVRRGRARRRRPGRRVDVVSLLLKKRLYSSPAAFAATVDVVATGPAPDREDRHELRSLREEPTSDDWPDDDWPDDAWAQEYLDTDDERETLDDETRRDEEDTALRRATFELGAPDDAVADLLDQMRAWARPFEHRADSKAAALISYLRGVCLAGDQWLNERVVVFTEYRDTQVWLEDLLRREGLTRDHRVGLLHGGLDADERERLRQQFQSGPGETPETKIRILLATDAAAEGIDLHWHCHRVVNYDIPFNPNRLEQRIGRIDRYGQREVPEVRHFVASGWREGRGGFEGDVDFLSRIATKITRVEADLGLANAVLAAAVQAAMLGRRVDLDQLDTGGPARGRISSDAGVREQVARLRAQLDATVTELEITPDRVRRVVGTGLRLARQAPLTQALDPDAVWEVPPLTGTWVRASQRLAHPLRPDERRPVTFDPEVARRRREDVVYAHLNHPLVAMASRLLSAAAASGEVRLSRTTLAVGSHPELTEPLAVAYARFLVVGGDAVRLHEEVLFAGGWVRPAGRFARVENLGLLSAMVGEALSAGRPAAPFAAEQVVADAWRSTEAGLVSALDWRVRSRSDQVRRALAARQDGDLRRNAGNFGQFARTLRSAVEVPEQEELPLTEPAELAQQQRDRDAMAQRLGRLPAEEAAEVERIRSRYADLTEHSFPLAVVYVMPEAR